VNEAAAEAAKWEPAAESLSRGFYFTRREDLWNAKLVKDPEDNASQLNRLGVAYSLLWLLSNFNHTLQNAACFHKLVGAQLTVLF
jgi:hypothetical protein